MNRSLLITVSELSRVGAARREVAQLARTLGFDSVTTGKVEIVVTEAATNLVKHSGQGQILLRGIRGGEAVGIEVIALDKGPGMADPSKCLLDGYSTAGGPGTGLGAIARLSHLFDIYTQPQKGTVLVAQVWAGGGNEVKKPFMVGAVCAPCEEWDACGDAWALWCGPGRSQVLVVDGLGHGVLASQAADEALKVFGQAGGLAPADAVKGMHGPLRSTRGASLALAEIDYQAGQVRYAGVGNISGVLMAEGKPRNMISHNGTVGHELHRVSEFQYPWSPKTTLIMHSDGLISRWSLEAYPGLIARHPSTIAGVMFRDFQRGRDDTTVVVLRASL